MSKRLLHKLFFVVQLLMFVGGPSLCYANTLTFQATIDFPVIDAGEVPYYKDSPARNALAINAAIEEYREKFARAEVIYDGQPGRFDMTIIGLAELDGAATYNLLINGVIVGTATNPSVVTDYTPIRHTFEDIDVPSGAILAVESLANSNDTVPEGDGFAFARGRWTALELKSADSAPTPSNYIDLELSMDSDTLAVRQGQEVVLTLNASNSSNSIVATTPLLGLNLPESGFEFVSGTNCSVISLLIECALTELAAGEETSVNVTLMATDVAPSAFITAVVRADQIDRFEVNNTASLTFAIAAGAITATPEPATGTDSITPVQPGANSDTKNETNRDTVESAGGLSVYWMLLLLSVGALRVASVGARKSV